MSLNGEMVSLSLITSMQRRMNFSEKCQKTGKRIIQKSRKLLQQQLQKKKVRKKKRKRLMNFTFLKIDFQR